MSFSLCPPQKLALTARCAGHYIAKLPETSDVPVQCHQDGWYWAFSPTRQVTVWLALDECQEENGAVRFYPGSHHLGLQHRGAGEEGVLCGRLEAACGEPQPALLRAGQVHPARPLCPIPPAPPALCPPVAFALPSPAWV